MVIHSRWLAAICAVLASCRRQFASTNRVPNRKVRNVSGPLPIAGRVARRCPNIPKSLNLIPASNAGESRHKLTRAAHQATSRRRGFAWSQSANAVTVDMRESLRP
jgi:hypothetical protein